MSDSEDQIHGLQAALAASPDNVPLRLLLADALLRGGHADRAIDEYKAALKRQPHADEIKLKLAQAYFTGGKQTEAVVVVEELLARRDTPPGAYLLHSRLLRATGEIDRAIRQYKRGVELDPTLADEAYAESLGIDSAPESDSEVVDGRVRGFGDAGEDEEPTAEVERPKIRFDAVGGMDALKEEIRLKIIHPLTHPEIYQAYGKRIGGGILLYGPPGCGKTHLARATAGEVEANFLSIGVSDVLDMWIGQSEAKLHGIFEQARRHAPCVLFFDEVDALAAKRSDYRQSAARQVINQFLAELDGYDAANEGLLILAATNAPWHLDSAFRRPGRFDRIIFVPPPDEPARAEILRILLRDKPTLDIDVDQVARKTKDFSGADLKAIVDQAIEVKLTDALKSGIPEPLSTRDLLAAAKKMKSSARDWFGTARNHALYANEGGLYDDVLAYLNMK